MFEYLMPVLVMPIYEGTLLDQTCRTAVARQIEYGTQRGVPGHVGVRVQLRGRASQTTSTGPSGVPGLGLKRGASAEDLVVAP